MCTYLLPYHLHVHKLLEHFQKSTPASLCACSPLLLVFVRIKAHGLQGEHSSNCPRNDGTKQLPCQGSPVSSGGWSCSFHPSRSLPFLTASKHWEYPKPVTVCLMAWTTQDLLRAFSLMRCVAIIALSKLEPGNKKKYI